MNRRLLAATVAVALLLGSCGAVAAPTGTTGPPPPSTTTVSSSTTSTTSTTAPSRPVFTARPLDDGVHMVWEDGSADRYMGPPMCLEHSGDLCDWHVVFSSAQPFDGFGAGFDGEALLVRLAAQGAEDSFRVIASVPVSTPTGVPVFRFGGEGLGWVIVLEWADVGPRETDAWLAEDGALRPVDQPRGLADSIGPGAERAVMADGGGRWLDISGASPAELPLWEGGGWMLDDIHGILIAADAPPPDGGPAEVWFGQMLGSAPDGTPLWWLLDWVPVPDGTMLSAPGECLMAETGVDAIAALERPACDICGPAGDWALAIDQLSLIPIDPDEVACTCVCEG